MSRIVVFGGNGFIGESLRTAIAAADCEYAAPTSAEIDLTDDSCIWDIKNQVKDGDSIIMIASKTAEHGEAYRLTDLNIRMASNLIRGIEGKKLAHFVYVSSDSVYGAVDGVVMESTPLCPENLYGYMHVIREKMFESVIPSSNLTILRPCAIYGVNDTHNAYGINRFIRSANISGEIVLFGEGEERRSNIHVDDAASIIAKAAMEKIPGIFNVNCGVSYAFMDIANLVQKNIGKEIKILSQQRTMPITHRDVDNSLLLKFFPPPQTAEEGIAEYCACLMD